MATASTASATAAELASVEPTTASLRHVEHQGIDQVAHLVATEGGGPTAAQRRQLAAFLGRRVLVAVVSDSARVRVSVWLLSWLNPQIKAFPRAQLADALAHLEIPTTRTCLVEDTLRRLRTVMAAEVSR